MRELSEHILDLVYNCIEGGARSVRVAVIEDSRADRLSIRVSDDGRGMDEAAARRALDPFYTTRTTRRVGLGLPLFAAAARRCGGDVEVCSRPGEGTTVSGWMRHSHIDRQPLGNVPETIVAAILSAPDIAFEYHHEVDGRCFTFNSSLLKEAAGDLPPSHPAVAQWLRAHLAEGIGGLGRLQAIGH
ncbi:MAG: ATP-binding protein [Armatimonadetes bacterium]|nr:ATP-binding protein [Armatimonadota bacterium]